MAQGPDRKGAAPDRRCACCQVELLPRRPGHRCGFCADPQEPCGDACGPIYSP